MNTAAIYVRASTADQHVGSQVYDLRELAAKRGFEVVKEYRDCGVSGRRARRTGLDAFHACPSTQVEHPREILPSQVQDYSPNPDLRSPRTRNARRPASREGCLEFA